MRRSLVFLLLVVTAPVLAEDPFPGAERRHALLSVATPADYLKVAAFDKKNPTTAERAEMDRFVRDSMPNFFRLNPTVDDVLTLLSTSVTDQRLSVDLRKAALKRTRGIEEYLQIASPIFQKPDLVQRAALDRFIDETREEFLARKPSVADFKDVERRSITSQEVRVRWLRSGMSVVNSLASFLNLTDKEKDRELIIDSLPTLVDRGALQINELKILEAERASTPEEHLAFLRAGLPLVKTAEDFIQIARFTDDSPSPSYRETREKFLVEFREVFLSRNPSPGQIERLRLFVKDAEVAAKLRPVSAPPR